MTEARDVLAGAHYATTRQSDMDEDEVAAFRRYSEQTADRILAASPRLASALELGLAWLDVVDVLPEGWRIEATPVEVGWAVDVWDQAEGEGEGYTASTAAGALQALARALHDRLQSRGKEPDR